MDAAGYEVTYEEGYRAGWLDAALGCRSTIAVTSLHGWYAAGYRDGQIAHRVQQPLDPRVCRKVCIN